MVYLHSTMKVMLGELTDKSNQGKAFAAFTVSGLYFCCLYISAHG